MEHGLWACSQKPLQQRGAGDVPPTHLQSVARLLIPPQAKGISYRATFDLNLVSGFIFQARNWDLIYVPSPVLEIGGLIPDKPLVSGQGAAGWVYGAELWRLPQLQLWAVSQGNVPVVFGLVSGWLGPYPVLEEQHMAEKDHVRNVNLPLGFFCPLPQRGLQALSFGIHTGIYWGWDKEPALILHSGYGSFCVRLGLKSSRIGRHMPFFSAMACCFSQGWVLVKRHLS